MLRGIDTDNYDGDVSVQRFKNLYDKYEVKFNIVGCQVGQDGKNYTKGQIANSESAGLGVPFTYEFLYWDANDTIRMQRAASYGKPVAIDCEYSNGMNGDPNATLSRILLAKETLIREGQYWGIYTGEWWWVPQTQNSTLFSGDKLWHGAYPYNRVGQPPILPPYPYLPDFATARKYGGWTRPFCWQYADICYDEPSFDMNAMELEFTTLPPGVKDGWLKEGRQWKLYNEGHAVLVVGDPAGSFPGQIAKLFGDRYYYLRTTSNGDAVWYSLEGD